ncbi:MAG: 16S rRNA (adenine(1518)-N(6)/adenine(1519)-N(6))-dimethyltransferase RsmA [Gemmatimonadota bacterium]
MARPGPGGGAPRLPRPRKRFGQHFLADRGAIAGIVDLVQPGPGDLVVEVGPGRGALTHPLAARLDRLVAVEIDRDLAAHLRGEIPGPGFRLVEGDILTVDLGALLSEEGRQRLIVVGNLPYNITAPVLFHMLDHAAIVDRAIFTLQREVARRLVAAPGSREYGLVTVMLRQRARARICLDIHRSAFRPVPKVDSAVVEIRFGTDDGAVRDQATFEQVARAAFQQRRKMLRNALKTLPAAQQAGIQALEERAGVDLSRRAETLSLAEFVRLADAAAELTATVDPAADRG